MNKNGFTLVELLGVVVILSIIMLIAIPNVASTLDKSKKDTYIADAKKLVSLVQYEIRKGNVSKPASNGTLVKVTLGSLETSNVTKDPDGYTYDTNNSYILVVRKNDYLVYYVQLIANTSNTAGTTKYSGIRLTNIETLEGDQRYTKFLTNITLPTDSEINAKKTSND